MFWYSQCNVTRLFTALSSCQVARQHSTDIYIQFHIHIRIRWRVAREAALGVVRWGGVARRNQSRQWPRLAVTVVTAHDVESRHPSGRQVPKQNMVARKISPKFSLNDIVYKQHPVKRKITTKIYISWDKTLLSASLLSPIGVTITCATLMRKRQTKDKTVQVILNKNFTLAY